MAKESDKMRRKEAELARKAAKQGDTGRPGDGRGRGRRDVTGITNVYPASGPVKPPADAKAQPMGTFGQGDRGPQGFEDSGSSEIIPTQRLAREDSARQRHGQNQSGVRDDDLSGLHVAALVTDGFEQSELFEPTKALRHAGARVEVVSPKTGTVLGFHHFDQGQTVHVDRALRDANPDDYDALLLPGGALNADALRVVPEAQAFARRMQDAGKPIAVICHGPWLLVSAGLARGRRLTSYHTIQDDIRNAGGDWLDQEVVEDANWVSSRQPSDLPAFNRAMLRLFARIPAHG